MLYIIWKVLEPYEIKYLDFDSITSLYVIKNNRIEGLSCSLRYAAPELISGDIQK